MLQSVYHRQDGVRIFFDIFIITLIIQLLAVIMFYIII